jgi:hypothetical protein
VLRFDAILYADRWSLLPTLEGLPKPISFLRGRNACGVLQATYHYEKALPWAQDSLEAFFQAAHRDSGETIERSVWGGFYAEGRKSVWTLILNAEEVEDNHTIAKKLRRLKQAVSRMFAGPGLDAGSASETEGSESETSQRIFEGKETVSFEESLIFASGAPLEKPASLAGIEGVLFLTDGYGPAAAFAQVERGMKDSFGIELSAPPAPESSPPFEEAVSSL